MHVIGRQNFYLSIQYLKLTANSQVHELHPSHAFCIVPDRPIETQDDSYLAAAVSETHEELCEFKMIA